MAVYKEDKTGTWRVIYRYTDWNGERKQTQKRGFKTRREAQAWEHEQLNKKNADLDMKFKSFVELYTADVKTRLKENTWATKEHIIRTKLEPYFGKLKMCAITPQQIITWQNELINYRDEQGKAYSPVYLKTVNNQLSAIFNHAVKYYNLRENPCKKAGSMGKKKNREMQFWTKEEYLKFAGAMMDKPLSYYAFEMLYWCGLREGELLALTPSDFDFEKRTVSITKSYHKLHTLDGLENRLALLHTEIDEVKADLDARHARMKELRELITCTEQYERFKPLYDELCSIKWKSKREQFKSEYESELRQFYMARRKLRGGIHIAEWRRELAMLERESNAAYAKYKAPRDELSELLDVKYCIVHALAAREAKGRVSRPLNKLQPERE